MGPRGLTKENAQLTRQNDFSFTQVKLVYCLISKTLKCDNFGSETLYVSSKTDITLQKQLGATSPLTQTVYFWRLL